MVKLTALFLTLLAAVCADTLVFKDGKSVTGTWVGVDSGQVSFLVDNQLKTYPRADVSNVTFGSADSVIPPLAPLNPPPDSKPIVSSQEAPNATAPMPEKQALPEPEYINQFFLLDSTASLKPLEHATVTAETKSSALGLGHSSSAFVIEGEQSTVRLAQNPDLIFIVRLSSRDVDPVSVVRLYRLQAQNGRREIQRWKGSLTKTKVTQFDSTLPFVAEKYGEKSFTIKPKGDLAPGEYALVENVHGSTYCFGVDAVLK
jgi:hypothetical protein